MELTVEINKLKCINYLIISLPLEKGLYAITGQNGSGKSTIVTCASSSFYMLQMNDYFGETAEDAYIKLSLSDGTSCVYKKIKNKEGKFKWRHQGKKLKIKGFYEGSLIYGNRFKNAQKEVLRKFSRIKPSKSNKADEFIRTNLGRILQGDDQFYDELYLYEDKSFNAPIFLYKKNGHIVSQFYMSTGENLMIIILYSLLLRINDSRAKDMPCLILLDEIELAMHPSSLKRLTDFLREVAEANNFAIYFSTHSLEVIASINPKNIFYINKHIDNSYEIVNPCYHAYATRILYDHQGYDNVFLVEDVLAKSIIERIMIKEKLKGAKLVHVLPAGGFTNVIDLAYDVVKSNLLTKTTSVAMILDKDIEDKAKKYKKNKAENFNVPLNFLPVKSLEKYLKEYLVEHVNHELHRNLNDYLFTKKSLDEIAQDYKREKLDDSDGKQFFKRLINNLKECGKTEADLTEMVVDFLMSKDPERVSEITIFLRKELS